MDGSAVMLGVRLLLLFSIVAGTLVWVAEVHRPLPSTVRVSLGFIWFAVATLAVVAIMEQTGRL